MARNGGFLSKLLPIFKAGLGGPLSSGKQWMSWIHIEDVVHLIDFLIHIPSASGIFNMCAPEPITNQEFTKTLSTLLQRPALFPVPRFALQLRYGKELTNMLLSSQRVLPVKAQALGFEFKFPELSHALNHLLTE